MPPKAKFTREEVIAASLALVRERGAESITARELGAKLGSSARPIFTLFHGMDEVLRETERAAREIYNGYIAEGLRESLPFKGVGRAYIRFAMREPKLFRLLFLRAYGEDIGDVLPALDENYSAILNSIVTEYGVDEKQALWLYRHLWIYTHGIATLCERGLTVTEKETDGMLTEVFVALLVQLKRGGVK